MKKAFEKHIIMSGFEKKAEDVIENSILMKAAIYFCKFKNFADLKNLLNTQWSSHSRQFRPALHELLAYFLFVVIYNGF